VADEPAFRGKRSSREYGAANGRSAAYIAVDSWRRERLGCPWSSGTSSTGNATQSRRPPSGTTAAVNGYLLRATGYPPAVSR